ncbi:Dyp-type peroxidase [Corynebacterium sp.]|uniref:Dyp-type peroxidase n=1 Tax=Corynebacterium sp. TaxID=1720 RepID=UPI002F3FA388
MSTGESSGFFNVSRRGLFAGVGAAGAAAVLASCAEGEGRGGDMPNSAGDIEEKLTVPFDGARQAGIQTPHQSHGLIVAFDFHNTNSREALRKDLRRLMRVWTPDARKLTQGDAALADLEPELNLQPGNLTITVGWSPALIDKIGSLDEVPKWVSSHTKGLPKFKGDDLDPAFSDGDVVVQMCGEDLTTLSHAMRVLTRGGRDYVKPRWTQRGFVDIREGQTARNLMGFKDGTVVPRTDEEFDNAVWDDRNGTSMIVRRVTFDMPGWEALDRESRENVFGRKAISGAPLTGEDEFDDPDLNAVDSTGLPVIDPKSHVGITAGEGKHMLRRPFNWDGEVNEHGDSGLIFICFQEDPDTSFTPLQHRLAENDRLNQWITHTGSGVYWVLPGTEPGSYWGQQILEG